MGHLTSKLTLVTDPAWCQDGRDLPGLTHSKLGLSWAGVGLIRSVNRRVMSFKDIYGTFGNATAGR